MSMMETTDSSGSTQPNYVHRQRVNLCLYPFMYFANGWLGMAFVDFSGDAGDSEQEGLKSGVDSPVPCTKCSDGLGLTRAS